MGINAISALVLNVSMGSCGHIRNDGAYIPLSTQAAVMPKANTPIHVDHHSSLFHHHRVLRRARRCSRSTNSVMSSLSLVCLDGIAVVSFVSLLSSTRVVALSAEANDIFGI